MNILEREIFLSSCWESNHDYFVFYWPCISLKILGNKKLDGLFRVFIYLFHFSPCFERHSAYHQEIEFY